MNFKNLQEFFWPTIHDAESAKKAADQGFMAAILYVFLALTPILSGQVAKIFDVIVVAIAGYFTKRMWRTAAIVGLVMMGPELVFALPDGVSFRLASAAILTLMFVNAARGTFLYPRYAKPPQPTVEVIEPASQANDAKRTVVSSGSGFFVSTKGHILTNQHVIKEGEIIKARKGNEFHVAKIIKQDLQNDLALLKIDSVTTKALSLRLDPSVRSGESVIALGFPLSGILSDEPHVTTGIITALAGMGNDMRFLQMTTPVQPGNSGGPLLDEKGNVIGIVVSKFDALKFASATGDIPQNVNFAINARIAQILLESQSIPIASNEIDKQLSTADIVESVKDSLVLIQCES
jgi:S1-C subfamily serine protease